MFGDDLMELCESGLWICIDVVSMCCYYYGFQKYVVIELVVLFYYVVDCKDDVNWCIEEVEVVCVLCVYVFFVGVFDIE